MDNMEKAWEVTQQIATFYKEERYTDKAGRVWLGIEGETHNEDCWLREDKLVSMTSADMTKKMIRELMDWDETPVKEDPYEYSVQFTVKGRKMAPQGWSSKEFAEEWFNSGQKSGDGEWGPWSKKLVKRRKAGKVQDA